MGGGNQRPLPLGGAAPCPPCLGHLGRPLHLCPVGTAATTAANPRPRYRGYHAVPGRRVLGKGDNLGPRETASAGTCTGRTLPPPMSLGDQGSSLRHRSFQDTWPPENPVHKYRPRSERHKGLEGEGRPYLQLYLAPRGLYTHPAGLPRRKSQVTKLSYFKQPLERFGFG